MKKQIGSALASVALVALVMVATAPAGFCQRAKLAVDPTTGNVELKAMTSADLKAAVAEAERHGDINSSDAKELTQKITDIETLMQQFDFIREQERAMVGTLGSFYH